MDDTLTISEKIKEAQYYFNTYSETVRLYEEIHGVGNYSPKLTVLYTLES